MHHKVLDKSEKKQYPMTTNFEEIQKATNSNDWN